MTPSFALPHRYDRLVSSPTARLVAGAAAFLVASVASSSDDGLVLCPFRRCTGGYCPGCGLTRSSGKLIRGDLVGSWHQHPFLVIGLAQAAVLTTLWGSRSRLWPTIQRRWSALLVANTALLVAIWVARLAAGHVPAPFS